MITHGENSELEKAYHFISRNVINFHNYRVYKKYTTNFDIPIFVRALSYQ